MSSITRPDELRTSNRRSILQALRRNPAQSRTFLSSITGLSAATLSAISNDLINDGILLESNLVTGLPGKSKRGRPTMQLSPNPGAALVIAASLTLNQFSVTLVDYAGSVLFEHTTQLPTQSLGRAEISHRVIRCISQSLRLAQLDPTALTHIELAFEGVTDVTNGVLMWSPILQHKGIPIKDKLQQKFGVTVSVKNDCSMIAGALSQQMHEELGSTFSTLLFSHGLGMSVFHDNQLISGVRTSATEFGHMLHQANGALCRCGKYGCIEAYAANYALWRRASGIDVQQPVEMITDFSVLQPMIDRARQQQGPERQAFVEAGHAIGTGLGNLFVLLDSFPVVLVGPLTTAFDLMEPAIREGIQHGIREDETVSVPILCFPDDRTLLRDGCIQAALDAVDLSCFLPESSDHA